MLYRSQFVLLAFLPLLCAAVSGCMTTSVLSSDPKTAEEILRSSTEHGARVTLRNGETVQCSAVALRRDTTTWRLLGEDVSVPTDSIASIEAATPDPGKALLLGSAYSAALPFLLLIGASVDHGSSSEDISLGAAVVYLSAVEGGLIGWLFGLGHETNWTQQQAEVVRNPHRLEWDSWNQRWIYPPTDSLHRHDAKQTTLPY